MRRRDAAVGERMKKKEEATIQKEEEREQLRAKEKPRGRETEEFKINKMPRENVFGSLQNLVFLIRLRLFSTFCSRSFSHSFVPKRFFSQRLLVLYLF